MKKIVLFLVLILLTGCTSDTEEPLNTGEEPVTSSAIISQSVLFENDQAYNIKVMDNDKNELELFNTFSTPTVLYFWTTWAEESDIVNGIIHEVSMQYDDIDFISVNALALEKDSLETILKDIRKSNYNYNVYYDYNNEATQTYHISSFPTMYVINTEGTITEILRNRISKEDILQALQEIE